jgi:type I restriction enzyme M protein
MDARRMGRMVDRVHRELTDEDIRRIATYYAWRGVSPHPASGHPLPVGEGRGEGVAVYRDIPGFCKSATLEEIRRHGYVLTPGRYVGAAEQEDDGEPFDQKMQRLVAQLREQQAEAAKLDAAIAASLKELGYGG